MTLFLIVMLSIVIVLQIFLIIKCQKILNCMVDFVCDYLGDRSKDINQKLSKDYMISSMYRDVLKKLDDIQREVR